MDRPPRRRGTPVLDRAVLRRAFGFLGPIEAVLSLSLVPVGAALFLGIGLGGSLPDDGADLALLSTLVFAAIVAMQMGNAFACRSTHASIATIGLRSNPLLLAAVSIELVALAVAVYVPGVNDALGQVPLDASQWLLVLPLPFVLLALEEARKAAARRRMATVGERSHALASVARD
jgi:magnesium-transporting ATPase (P-type)